MPTLIAKTGYIVTGYYDTSSQLVVTNGGSYTLNSSNNGSTIYARSNKLYTATLKKQTGVNTLSKTSLSCYSEIGGSCKVTLPSITASSGYEVLGWYNGDTFVTSSSGGAYMLSKDVTLTAKAQKISYTYIANLKTTTGVSAIGSQKISCTTTASSCAQLLPSITAASGYTVIGWSSDSSGNNIVGQVGESYSLKSTSGETLYAIAQKEETVESYSINLEYDNGTTSSSTKKISCQTSSSSCKVTLPTIFTKIGYVVKGWYKEVLGTNKLSSSVLTLTSSNNGTTLYALTEATESSYVINFAISDKSEGISSISETSYTCNGGSCIVTLPEIIVENGYTLLGWYDAEDNFIGYSNEDYEFTEETTIYAVATLIQNSNNTDNNEGNTTENEDTNKTDNNNSTIDDNSNTTEENDAVEEEYSCKYINGNYYDKEGNIVDKTTYENVCGDSNPNTGTFISIVSITSLLLIGTFSYIAYVLIKKKNIFNKI